MQIPSGLSGAACVIVSTGAYGQPGWREVKLPVNLLATPPEIDQITIDNPISVPLTSGANATVFGKAFSSSASSLNITIRLQDGSVINEGGASIEPNNLWMYSFEIPSTASGRLFVEARLGEAESNKSINEIVTFPIQNP